MPQTSETGRQGRQNGYNRADPIDALLRADRLTKKSNEFRWGGRIVLIKTGSSAVVTRATLARAALIVYGEEKSDGWTLYEIARRYSRRYLSNQVAQNTMRTTYWSGVHKYGNMVVRLM